LRSGAAVPTLAFTDWKDNAGNLIFA